MKQLDLEDAIAARDAALARVAANSGRWIDRALAAVAALPGGFTGTSEAIRLALTKRGLEAPHHHNAWGALARTAIRRGLLAPTGRFEQMTTKKSHARMSPVYRLCKTVTESSK